MAVLADKLVCHTATCICIGNEMRKTRRVEANADTTPDISEDIEEVEETEEGTGTRRLSFKISWTKLREFERKGRRAAEHAFV